MTDRRFWRRSIGSEQRVANLIEHLAARRDARVVVAYLGRSASAERDALDAFRAGLPTLEIRSRPAAPATRLIDAFADALASAAAGASAAARAALHRLHPSPSPNPSPNPSPSPGRNNPLLGPGSPARRRFVQSLLRELAPHVVLVEFLRLTPTVHPRSSEPGGSPPAYLVDTHDVLHERAARFRAHGAAPSLDVDAQQEAQALATYDTLLAIQARDAETLQALVPARPVLIVPHGLALPRLEPMSAEMSATMSAAMPASAPAPGSRPLRLGFLGGRDASNRDGLRWFLDAVWPPLRGRFGAEIELRVAGSLGGEARRAGAGDGVVWVGPVASIDLFWPTVDVAINPIRFGTGLKIKNVEALAYRRALITTPVGAEGLEAAAPTGLAIAETPAEWIQVLSGWIADPAALARTAEAGRLHAERCFAPAAAFRALDEHLDLLEARALMPTEARA